MRRNISKYLLGALSLGLILFIFHNSLQDADTSGALSGWVVALLRPLLDPMGRMGEDHFHTLIRKLAHFSEFAALGMSLRGFAACADWKQRNLRTWMPPLTVLMVAAGDETIQLFVPGRHGSPLDVCIDFAGALTGILLIALLCRLRSVRA